MAKKFIIITTARSGSQMFCEFLDKQVNMRCELELLQAKKEQKHIQLLNKSTNNRRDSHTKLNSYLKCVEILGEDPSKFVGNRNRRFIEYLKIWEDMEPSEYFGFKVFFNSHLGSNVLAEEDSISYEDFAKYIKDNDIKIIHLTRDNILLKYISGLTSQITGVHSSNNTSKINSIIVEVLYKEFTEFKNSLTKQKHDVFNFCSINGIDVHHVTYENLTGDNHATYYRDILSFIGADPNLFIDIRNTPMQKKRKTNIYTIRHKVSNLDELIEDATKANDTELLDVINVELSKMGEI